MKNLRVMVTLALLWAYTIAAQAPAQDLVITENISPTKVEYVITNMGTTSKTVSFIIIQDDILMLTTGQETILPSESITIKALANTPSHWYDLELTVISSGN